MNNCLERILSEEEFHSISHIPEKGAGSYYFDTEGNKYLDFSSGIFTNTFGHSDPELAASIAKEAETLGNVHGRHTKNEVIFYEKLEKYLPSDDYLPWYFGDGGGYAVDRAEVLLYHYFHERCYNLGSFLGGFHGKTQGTLLTTSWQYDTAYFRSFPIPEPNCAQCPCGRSKRDCGLACAELAERIFIEKQIDAFLFEPVLGSLVVIPPEGYWRRICSFCKEHDILLVADEVLVGGGRTGTYLACEQFCITPDIIILTKGLANGWPLSVLLIRRRLTENWFFHQKGAALSTFSAFPPILSLACTVLDKIERDDILENVKKCGVKLQEGLVRLQERYSIAIKDVRAIGLMAAIEFKDINKKLTRFHLACSVFRQAEKNGLELIEGYIHVRFAPPLNVSEQEIQLGLNLLDKTISEVLNNETI